jgi:spore coat protein U-like protein
MSGHRTVALLLALLPLGAAAQAGIGCSAAVSPGVLAFGSYSPLQTGSVALLLGEVVVRCSNSRSTPPDSIQIRAGISAGTSGTVAQRQMRTAGSAVPLLYNLYRDAGYSQVWSDGLGGPGIRLPLPPGASNELRLAVFGRIPGGQRNVRAGAYGDGLVLTVRY